MNIRNLRIYNKKHKKRNVAIKVDEGYRQRDRRTIRNDKGWLDKRLAPTFSNYSIKPVQIHSLH